MDPRWKTAIRFGIIWGILMTLFSMLFDLHEKSFYAIVTSKFFWLRSIGYTVLGIFPVGYFAYAGKEKSND